MTAFVSALFRSRIVWFLWRYRKRWNLGFDTVGCASTGNLANSVAANAAAWAFAATCSFPQTSNWARYSARSYYRGNVIGVNGSCRMPT